MSIRRMIKLLLLTSISTSWAILPSMSTSQAMPVFMELYDADPFSKAEYRGKCSICHASEDSGLRTEFGRAFIKNKYRITPEVRKSFMELFALPGESGPSPTAVSAFDSKKFFESNCATCHGNDGKGVAPGAPDFTDTGWNRGRTDEKMAEQIRNGRGIMPPFKDRLKGDELKVLISYIRRFARE